MAIPRKRRGVPRSFAGGVEAPTAEVRTFTALGAPSPCGVGATPLARSILRSGAAALLALALAGCDPYVQGNGVYYEESRNDVAPFVGLHVEDGIAVTVTAQAAAQSVLVGGDANVVPYIRTEVRMDGGRPVLHVLIPEQFDRTIPPLAVIAAPSFEYVRATQGARVSVWDAGTAIFTAVADQGSWLRVDGKSGVDPAGETIEVALASGAVLDATRYPVSQTASVELSGASNARLHSDGPVTGTVADASVLDNLYGTGDCAAVVKDASSQVSCH
jgi:hypothetical protein